MLIKTEVDKLRQTNKYLLLGIAFAVLIIFILTIRPAKKVVVVERLYSDFANEQELIVPSLTTSSFADKKDTLQFINSIFQIYTPNTKDSFFQNMGYLKKYSDRNYLGIINQNFLSSEHVSTVINSGAWSSDVFITSIKQAGGAKAPLYNFTVQLQRRTMYGYSRVEVTNETYLVTLARVDRKKVTKVLVSNQNKEEQDRLDGVYGYMWGILIHDIKLEKSEAEGVPAQISSSESGESNEN